MIDEPFDISKLVNAFELTTKTGLSPEITDGENLYFHEFSPPPVDINFTFENNAIAILEAMLPKRKSIMKMEQRGKYWFDTAFDADVIMTEITLEQDGSFSATYESMNIIDKTDRRPLARFLRWILRR